MFCKVKLLVPYDKVRDSGFMVQKLQNEGYDIASVLNVVSVGEPTFANGVVMEVACLVRNPIITE
ncbi:MAG TPA: hypothetical protein PLV72_02040 [Candidatus Magasanikbacteria bacterium]|nr:hypothetical protein [Candidatus Magasanikbacteria bacterium]